MAHRHLDVHRALDTFPRRHIGPRDRDVADMLEALGFDTLDGLADATVPGSIRLKSALELDGLPEAPLGEFELLEQLKEMSSENLVYRSYIGMGYSDTIVPPVVLRNVMENPGWYTQYTPYQAEISQGRLEALLLFQTAIAELTGLPLAGASLLDEATAAAEAFNMCRAISKNDKINEKSSARPTFFIAEDCHPQTIGVVRTRAESVGVEIVVGDPTSADFEALKPSGVLLQYPATDGGIVDPRPVIERAHAAGALAVIAADVLALCVLESPGTLGADIAVGSSQRFGVPMGFGGPHAGYLSTLDKHARKLPGRLVGVSVDRAGRTAYRLAVQTREQHIRRERATSNICTAQVLLAIMASMYCVYHGPDGLRDIAARVHGLARCLAAGLRRLGHGVRHDSFFDTLRVDVRGGSAESVISAAWERGMNLRPFLVENAEGQLRSDGSLGVALDETTKAEDIMDILEAFAPDGATPLEFAELEADIAVSVPEQLERTTPVLTHDHFTMHHSETEMLRYLNRLQAKDLSLTTSMIPLGSCTMKLNATVEMIPVTWPEFGRLHPYAPSDQVLGYQALFEQLETWLGEITGLPVVSLQPNAGSQGELAGLLAIRRYHEARGDTRRDVCLIPVSAHGTNAASAVIAGFRCVAVACDDAGNVNVDDLKNKCQLHEDELGALMITYPSTHGVFEESVQEICDLVHQHGGQVYMDGANMNAQVGLTSPAAVGADVCHLNLHKTFSIPHGGGGPGMGPICAAEHLADFMPGDPVHGEGAVSAAAYGSASILPISWVYIALMGGAGLTRASQVAILNANYMAKRLSDHYEVLYTGPSGLVAHEFIVDCRNFEKTTGIVVEDIAKRLMDYGFHAPTMSFPVPGTLMIEPTESESRAELDRFCEAMIRIRGEIRAIEQGRADRDDNPLKHAPHTAHEVSADEWPHVYSRQEAAWPTDWLRQHKYWPPVSRIDNAYGDRNLMCTCPPLLELAES